MMNVFSKAQNRGRGCRGLRSTLSLHEVFNYILGLLYMGCQRKMLLIEANATGRPENPNMRIYRLLRCRRGAVATMA
jgi:hypothetical protein